MLFFLSNMKFSISYKSKFPMIISKISFYRKLCLTVGFSLIY